MSPEQVTGEPVDARTDVYALGILLYEILTLEAPFRGKLIEVMSAHLDESPTPPRMRAPERDIPLELERACLKALAKDPADRQQTARELHDEVQSWLEAAADRAKRRERAGELAAKGRIELNQYYELKEVAEQARQRVEEIRKRFHDWQSVEDKRPLFEAEDDVAKLRSGLAESASNVVMTLSAALGQDPEHPDARRSMAEFYWDRFQDAERRRDFENRDYFSKLVASFHDGRYTREPRGEGSLQLTCSPPGTDVTLYRLEERGLVLEPGSPRALGFDPIGPLTLPMGSYLAVARKEGYREARYPVWISRNRQWRGHLRLFSENELGNGFVHVPAGPFVAGGDDEVRGWSLPASEVELDDFFISVHPVTVREYQDFLDELAKRDPGEALARSPRRSPDGGFYSRQSHPRSDLPVVSISWYDAVAYCAFRSEKDGRKYDLPTELEWEKAARGVDGRWYPWGNRFDASLSNVSGSLSGEASVQPMDSFGTDVSIYGVHGLGGNIRDWTAGELGTERGDGQTLRIVRGGAFNLPAVITRSANRFWLSPSFVVNYVGFRMVHRPHSS